MPSENPRLIFYSKRYAHKLDSIWHGPELVSLESQSSPARPGESLHINQSTPCPTTTDMLSAEKASPDPTWLNRTTGRQQVGIISETDILTLGDHPSTDSLPVPATQRLQISASNMATASLATQLKKPSNCSKPATYRRYSSLGARSSKLHGPPVWS